MKRPETCGTQLAVDWQTILAAADDGVIVADAAGVVAFCNKAAAGLLATKAEDVCGQPVEKAVADSGLAALLAAGRTDSPQTLKLGDRVVSVRISPVRSGKENIGTLAVLRDISDKEALAAELNGVREKYRELETIFESVAEGIIASDRDGYVTRVNEAYRRLAGISKLEYIGKHIETLVEEGYTHRTTSDVAIERKAAFTALDIRNNRELLITSTPLIDENGDIAGCVGVLRDMDSLIAMRDQLAKDEKYRQKYAEVLAKLRTLESYKAIITQNARMRERVETALRVARVNSTVLILGESGVGKELLAQMIHRASRRSQKPFVKVDCTTIPSQLMEAELFGYEANSFTGAPREGRVGLIEMAQQGTLFIDEVGELPLEMQSKILRAIQDRQIVRIGGRKTIKLDVRIVAATNRNLEKMVKEKTFREDLYYRLNVVPILLPPLRERAQDIPLLVTAFVENFNREYGYQKWVHPDAMKILASYDWPGNVRELHNVVERLVVTTREDCLVPASLEGRFIAGDKAGGTRLPSLKTLLETEERRLLEETYKSGGSTRKIAELLGISQSAVVKKLKKYGIA